MAGSKEPVVSTKKAAGTWETPTGDTARTKPPIGGSPAKAPSRPVGVSESDGAASDAPADSVALNGISKRKRGGQPGNRHGFRHGLRGTGKLPPELAYLEIRLNAFRRHLEDTVLAAKGEIDLADGAAINSALKWEKHGALAQRWLTTQYDELKPLDRLAFSREIARASGERDKAIATLGLKEVKQRAPWLMAVTSGDDDDE